MGSTIKAATYTGIYGLHKYWSKKPFNVVRDLIDRYSEPGDIVADPFCGSGVTVAEALLAGRKIIGGDINPAATFITRQILSPVAPTDLLAGFQQVEFACRKKIQAMYTISRGTAQFIGTHFIWASGALSEVWYRKGRQKVMESATPKDIAIANAFTYDQVPFFFPTGKLWHNPRINVGSELHVHELFTPRNLTALATLFHAIEQIASAEVQDLLKFVFTAALGQASKMVFVVNRRGKMGGKIAATNPPRKEVGSWVIGFWVPLEHFEVNVWDCFEHRFNKVLKTKSGHVSIAPGNLLLKTGDARAVLQELAPNSVDYVLTDPPHGDRIPYLELSQIWNQWLRFNPDFAKEIVISDAKGRGKNLLHYRDSMTDVFRQIERVLKPGGHFTLMFNSLDDDTWLFLIQALSACHFVFTGVETFQYSARSVVQECRQKGLKSDFILTLRKDPAWTPKPVSILSRREVERHLQRIIANNPTFLTLDRKTIDILNQLLVERLHQGEFCRISDVLQIIGNF